MSDNGSPNPPERRRQKKPQTRQLDLDHVELARRVFWQNVVREILTSLSAGREARPELFDGRLAVLTHAGERIPIADVHPMFACSLIGSTDAREMSAAVECSVFRVHTPTGEVFTLPLSEIRGLHTLTGQLVEQLERRAMEQMASESRSDRPFGFAAFRAREEEPLAGEAGDENAEPAPEEQESESSPDSGGEDTGSEQNPA